MKNKKKITVLSASVLLSAVVAFANPTTIQIGKAVVEETVTKVSTAAELEAAIAKSGSVELTQDIRLEKTLNVEEGINVKLNLAGFTLQTYDETYGEYNAFNNYGNLTIQNGSLYSSRNAVYTDYIGTTTLNSVTIDGFYHSVWNDGNTYFNNCVVNSIDDWEVIYNEAGYIELRDTTATQLIYNETGNPSDVAIYSGNYEEVSHLTIEGGTFNTTSLTGCVLNGGEYLQADQMVGFSNVVVPEDSQLSFTFKDANIKGSSLLGGTYDGTIKQTNGTSISYNYSNNVTYGKNFKMTEGLAKSLESSWYYHNTDFKQYVTGKKIQAIEGTSYYTVVDCATSVVKVALKDSTESKLGTVAVYLRDNFSTVYSSTTKECNQGEVFGIRVMNNDSANYDFVVYVDNNATPEQLTFTQYIDTNGKATNYYYASLNALEGTHTYYVDFIKSTAKVEYEAKVNAWLGDYDNTAEYSVNSKEEMGYFAYAVNQGKNFKNKIVRLTGSLDYVAAEAGSVVDPYDFTTSTTYLPVGNESKAFEGTFDGQNNIISGINVSCSGYAGIFGHSKGVIKNLNVTGCSFTGSYAGGIVGECAGTVENCKVTNSSIEANRFGGGLIGHTFGMTVKNAVVDTVEVTCYWKAGGLVGYADGLTVQNVSLTNVTNGNTTGNGIYGAAIGHANSGANVLENMEVTDENNSLIGTNYSSSTGSITITGENTNVTTKSIIPSSTDASKSVKIENGNYHLQSVVEQSETGTENVDVLGGSYNIDVSSYLENEQLIVEKDENGQYVVKNEVEALKIAAVDGNAANDLGLRFYMNSEEYAKQIGKGYQVCVEVKKALYNGNDISGYETLILSTPSYQTTMGGVTYEVFAFNGIKFYEMTSDITVTTYTVDSEGTRVDFDVFNTSFAKYAQLALTQYSSDPANETKIKLIKSLLETGTFAQQDKGYHLNDLANSYIPA